MLIDMVSYIIAKAYKYSHSPQFTKASIPEDDCQVYWREAIRIQLVSGPILSMHRVPVQFVKQWTRSLARIPSFSLTITHPTIVYII